MEATLEFAVEGYRLAVPVALVVQVTRAAAVTPVPQVPAIVQGVLDFHGEIIAVMDIRVRLGLAPRPLRLSDRLIVLDTPVRRVAVVVDSVIGLQWRRIADCVPVDALLPEAVLLEGIVRGPDGLILVVDAEVFLRSQESALIEQVLADHE